jgi:hypothetical protein
VRDATPAERDRPACRARARWSGRSCLWRRDLVFCQGKGSEDAEEVLTSTCDAQLGRTISLGVWALLSLVTQPPQPRLRAWRVSPRNMKDMDARPTSNVGCTARGSGNLSVSGAGSMSLSAFVLGIQPSARLWVRTLFHSSRLGNAHVPRPGACPSAAEMDRIVLRNLRTYLPAASAEQCLSADTVRSGMLKDHTHRLFVCWSSTRRWLWVGMLRTFSCSR